MFPIGPNTPFVSPKSTGFFPLQNKKAVSFGASDTKEEVSPKDTPDPEEAELLKKIIAGDSRAWDKLHHKYKGLICNLARKYEGYYGISKDQLREDGLNGLSDAVMEFVSTPERIDQENFFTVAAKKIRTAIRREASEDAKTLKLDKPLANGDEGDAQSLGNLIEESREKPPDQQTLTNESNQRVQQSLKCLNFFERIVISLHFGLNQERPLSVEEIAKHLQTKSTILETIIKRGELKLSKYPQKIYIREKSLQLNFNQILNQWVKNNKTLFSPMEMKILLLRTGKNLKEAQIAQRLKKSYNFVHGRYGHALKKLNKHLLSLQNTMNNKDTELLKTDSEKFLERLQNGWEQIKEEDLQILNPHQRELLNLRLVQNLTFNDIGKMLEKTAYNIRSQFMFACKKLGKHMGILPKDKSCEKALIQKLKTEGLKSIPEKIWEKLTQNQQVILKAHIEQNQSGAEIAKSLGKCERTVCQSLQHALQKIYKELNAVSLDLPAPGKALFTKAQLIQKLENEGTTWIPENILNSLRPVRLKTLQLLFEQRLGRQEIAQKLQVTDNNVTMNKRHALNDLQRELNQLPAVTNNVIDNGLKQEGTDCLPPIEGLKSIPPGLWEKFSPNQQTILKARLEENLSVKEIATRLGRKNSHVRQCWLNAIHRIHKELNTFSTDWLPTKEGLKSLPPRVWKKLNSNQQTILKAHLEENLSIKEIAMRLGRTNSQVRKCLRKATHRIRKELHTTLSDVPILGKGLFTEAQLIQKLENEGTTWISESILQSLLPAQRETLQLLFDQRQQTRKTIAQELQTFPSNVTMHKKNSLNDILRQLNQLSIVKFYTHTVVDNRLRQEGLEWIPSDILEAIEHHEKEFLTYFYQEKWDKAAIARYKKIKQSSVPAYQRGTLAHLCDLLNHRIELSPDQPLPNAALSEEEVRALTVQRAQNEDGLDALTAADFKLLSPEQQNILNLFYCHCIGLNSICERLNLDRTTLSNRKHHALQQLRQHVAHRVNPLPQELTLSDTDLLQKLQEKGYGNVTEDALKQLHPRNRDMLVLYIGHNWSFVRISKFCKVLHITVRRFINPTLQSWQTNSGSQDTSF